jgi:short-subunit dehydrogenase
MATPATGIALVTGASAGIGAEFAAVLARRGHPVVLVARDRARLADRAGTLERDFGVATEVIAADLGTRDGVAAVEARLADRGRPVGLLVNNAGFGTYGRFADLDVAREQAEIELNVVALARLSHAALVAMAERKAGAIVNVSSIAGYQPMPHSTTYAATKAFVTSFTHALHEEARRDGVHVMLLCPGFTHSEFHARSGIARPQLPRLMWQTTGQVVAAAMRDLDRGRAVCIPGPVNRALAFVGTTSPRSLSRRVTGGLGSRFR